MSIASQTIRPPPMTSLPLPIVERPATCSDDGCSRDPFSPYRVSFWGSHPNDMDDCFTGCNYETELDALKAYFTDTSNYHVQCIMLDGPGLYQVRKNPLFDRKRIAQASIGFDQWFAEGLPELAPAYP